MNKKLLHILAGIPIIKANGNLDIEISCICFDSRKVETNCVYVAIKGTQTDGHDYIPQAIEKGAIAVICTELPNSTLPDITYIVTSNTAYALGVLSSNFYNTPSKQLKLIGVTGTNGKTTTVTLLYKLMMQLGHKAGCITTIANFINQKEIPSTHTTPDPVQLNQLLYEMVQEGCEYAFMEVSSHAIVQERIAGLHFTGGVFTNITHDHLDFHKTFAEYISAKKRFFDNLSNTAFALFNADDKNALVMQQNTIARKHTFALRTLADFQTTILENYMGGMQLHIDKHEFWTPLIGQFNAYNLTGIYAVACLLGFPKDEILVQMSLLNPVSGRFETIALPNGATAIVDYAHTPDALKNVLNTIRGISQPENQIITVVGAGGNRDKTKRPEMGKIASKLSTKVILTSDNPRNEDPNTIMLEMLQGVDSPELPMVLRIVDRTEAIRTAYMLSQKGDIILVAGKGHETYQEINGVKYPFDDKLVLKQISK